MESSRRLAAIMFTDIVGYTALMGKDEDKALAVLRRNIDIQRSLIEGFDGVLLKEMGDGILASFDTVSDAVYCAGAIQNACEAEEDLSLRIGIHLGEVVFEGRDVFGDGVNIASRIEALAPSGGIWVSESVHKNVSNKKGVETLFVKEAQLKNVTESVKIYEARVDSIETSPTPTLLSGSTKSHRLRVLQTVVGILAVLLLFFMGINYFSSRLQTDLEFEKSIAVLPFRNDSPNDENVYFCNGIMEGILDHLSKIPDLNVVSRTSVEQYRDNPLTTREIADDLGVNYILEGSVLRIGDQSKISAQLIHAREDRHIWSDQFDRSLDDVFSVLADVTQIIADELRAKISPEILERIELDPTSSMAAYDYYLQGKEYFNNFLSSKQKGDLDNAEALYNAALDLDPDFGLTYAGLARIHWNRNQYNFYKDEASVDTVLQLCNKAIALDANAADAYWVRGAFYDHILFEIEKAEKDLKKAIQVNPSHLDARRDLAFLLAFHNKDYISALKLLRETEDIDKSPGQLIQTYDVNISIYQSVGYWERCIEYHNKRKEVDPLTNEKAIIWLNFHQGKLHEALNIAKTNFDTISFPFVLEMAKAHLFLREYAQALFYFERWEKLRNESPGRGTTSIHSYHYAMALVKNGRVTEGIQMMQDQLKNNEEKMKTWQRTDNLLYTSAGICAFLGERDQAYRYLRRFDGSLIRWKSLIYLVQFDPIFDNLRKDNEFKSIINEVQGELKRIREELVRAEAIGELRLDIR